MTDLRYGGPSLWRTRIGTTHIHTHTHTQPFYGSVEFVRDNPGEPAPEETFTLVVVNNHPYPLSPSNMIHGIQKVDFAIFWIFWCKMKITQADNQQFNHICQVAPIFTPAWYTCGSWAKLHLDWFSRVCGADGRAEHTNMVTARLATNFKPVKRLQK